MSDNELADRLRHIADGPTLTLEARRELHGVADELDPPKPEPGTPIWFQQREGGPWEFGMTHLDDNYSDDVAVIVSAYDGFTFEQVHAWQPAQILGRNEVAIPQDDVRTIADILTAARSRAKSVLREAGDDI